MSELEWVDGELASLCCREEPGLASMCCREELRHRVCAVGELAITCAVGRSLGPAITCAVGRSLD